MKKWVVILLIISIFAFGCAQAPPEEQEDVPEDVQSVIDFCYNYLAYSELILKKCRPDIHKGDGFIALRKRYLEFYAKYFA